MYTVNVLWQCLLLCSVMIVLSWPVGQLPKCCTKRCLELQDNAVGCTTFIGVADRLAGLALVAIHMLICPVFYWYVLIWFLWYHPSCIIVSLSLITSVHICLLLLVALELYCSLSFASSFHFLSDCPQILLRFGVCIVAYAAGFFVMLFSMSASGSALAFCCFVEWHCIMCLLLLL